MHTCSIILAMPGVTHFVHAGHIPMQADGHLEYFVSSFWKQKYCKKHSSDGTPRCCSCNRLKPQKQQWLALSVGRRVLCHECSCTAVRSTSEAQPLYDNVGAPSFFSHKKRALTCPHHCVVRRLTYRSLQNDVTGLKHGLSASMHGMADQMMLQPCCCCWQGMACVVYCAFDHGCIAACQYVVLCK